MCTGTKKCGFLAFYQLFIGFLKTLYIIQLLRSFHSTNYYFEKKIVCLKLNAKVG